MMKTSDAPVDLLDVNVWLALADENHQHHRRARHYWERESAVRLAFCRVTMLGFLRLATHPKLMSGRPFSAQEAWQAYSAFRALPEIEILSDPPKLESTLSSLACQPDFIPSFWTDAYLAALAISASARLVSFDSDFHSFKALQFLHLQ
jgi:toxin-antitoxin system PIN domain toxin